MDLAKSKAGNRFFETKLKNYRMLGISYTDFWQKASLDFIRFQLGGTDQGMVHCKDLEHNIWQLIARDANDFPLEVLYVLSLSCALHDCVKTSGQPEHAVQGAKTIKENLVQWGFVQRQSTADTISYVVLAHSSGQFSTLPEIWDVGADVKVRLRDAAAIFRLADMMSTSEERASRLYKILAREHPTMSDFLTSVRLCIQSCRPSDSDRTSIDVLAYADKIDDKRNVERYVEGLNKDLTEEHKKLLQNIKLTYITKSFVRREKEITLPYKFTLYWLPSFLDALPAGTTGPSLAEKRDPGSLERSRHLVPCYFLNTETNIDIHKDLLDSITMKKAIDSKFLYWSLAGTKEYLSLCKNPSYVLPATAHTLLRDSFDKEIYPIIATSGRELQHVINLGVGDGVELDIILDCLISAKESPPKMRCSLVDFSYHMLRVAVNTLETVSSHLEKLRTTVELFAINGDFRNLRLYKDVLRGDNICRLFCFLGGNLGNFYESEVIEPIKEEMNAQDFLLLGADLIGDRSDEELIAAYDSIYNRKFLFSPLADIGFEFDRCAFKCEIKENVSEVPGSRTLVSWFSVEDVGDVQMAISTKYDVASLSNYIETRFNFRIVRNVVSSSKDYAILLLRK